MNSKMMLAFAVGLIVASGVTYIAMRRNAPVTVDTARTNAAAPVAMTPQKPPPITAEPAPDEPKPQPERQAAAPAQPRWRPAVPAKSRHAAPVMSARTNSLPYQQPPPPAQATPAAQPVSQPQQQAPPPAQVPPPPVETAKTELPVPPRYEPPHQPHTVTVPAGTTLTVRLGETLSTERNQPGDQFSAVLDQALVVDGFAVAERGSRVQGRIVELERSGKVRGVARLAIELTQLHTSDGQKVRVNTSAFNRQAEATRTRDAEKVGGGAALGAIIGAIAGGGKGAAVGAGVGGAAGAGDVALTRGKPAELKVETRVSFRMSEAVTITERLQ